MSEKLKSTPLKIAEHIKDEIELGKLKPGDRLPSERDLVKELGVSRSSVREAVKYLTTMGYLEAIERKGTFISKQYIDNQYANSQLNKVLNAAPVFDLMEVRMLLEEKFISLAVKRATDEDFENLKMILERIKHTDGDFSDFLKADLEFHLALAEATHNQVIIELMKVIIKRIYDNEEVFKASGHETKQKTIEAFEKIIYHLTKRNVTQAELLYHNHIYLVDHVLKKCFVELEYDI